MSLVACELPQALCWEWAGMRHELRTELGELAGPARAVLGHWRDPAPPAGTCRWAGERFGNGYVLRDGEGKWLATCSSPEDFARHLELHCVHALFTQETAPLAFHAALLRLADGSAIALVGRCGAGKSTLAVWLWHHRGLGLLCDDAMIVREEPGWVTPVPRRISVRASSREALGEKCWLAITSAEASMPTEEGHFFSPGAGAGRGRPVRIAALFLLDRFEGSAGSGEALAVAAHEAVFALAPYNTARRRAKAIEAAAGLAGHVPVFELGRAAPPAMASAIEQALGRPVA